MSAQSLVDKSWTAISRVVSSRWSLRNFLSIS